MRRIRVIFVGKRVRVSVFGLVSCHHRLSCSDLRRSSGRVDRILKRKQAEEDERKAKAEAEEREKRRQRAGPTFSAEDERRFDEV